MSELVYDIYGELCGKMPLSQLGNYLRVSKSLVYEQCIDQYNARKRKIYILSAILTPILTGGVEIIIKARGKSTNLVFYVKKGKNGRKNMINILMTQELKKYWIPLKFWVSKWISKQKR